MRLRALAHPLRLQILSLLTGVGLSAAELARELGTTEANASYHVRRLRDAGLLTAVGEVPARGGAPRRYRHDPGNGHTNGRATSDGEPQPAPGAGAGSGSAAGTVRGPEADTLVRALASELIRRQAHRDPDGRATVTDAELWVDPGVWADVVERVERASLELHAAARPPRTPGTRPVTAVMVLFPMRPDR